MIANSPAQLLEILISADIVSKSATATKLSTRSWRISDAARDKPFTAKLIPAEEQQLLRGLREAHANPQAMHPFVQAVDSMIELPGATLVLLPWRNGDTLRESGRQRLPEFFAELRWWHGRNANQAPLYSPFTKQHYPTIADFLEGEVRFHMELAALPGKPKDYLNTLKGLHQGFVSCCHGDVHPGNILFDGETFTLLDPEYVHNGLNLLELDYIELQGDDTDPDAWWQIADPDRACVSAYFAGDGLSVESIEGILHSVKLLTLIRSASNAVLHDRGNAEECVERVLAFSACLIRIEEFEIRLNTHASGPSSR